MKFVTTLLVLAIAFIAGAQNISYTYSTSDPEETVKYREIYNTADNGMVAAFDLEKNGVPPTAGIMKLNELGYIEWSKLLDISHAGASCSFNVVEAGDGSIFLHGLNLNSTTTNMVPYLMKVSATGDVIFYKELSELGYPGSYSVNRMYLLANGNIQLLVSIFDEILVIQLDQNGDLIWGKSISNDNMGSGKNPGFDVVALQSGKYMSTAKTGNDFMVTLYGVDGTIEWIRHYSMGTYAHLKSIMQSENGEIYSLGYTNTISGATFQVVLLQIDEATGDLNWVKSYTHPNLSTLNLSRILELDDGLMLSLSGLGGPGGVQQFITVDFDGNFIQGIQTSISLSMGDYGNLNMSSGDYFFSGYALSSTVGEPHGFILKTNDIMDLSCIEGDEITGSTTVFTDYVDTTHTYFVSDYPLSDIINSNAALIDQPIILGEICEELTVQEGSNHQLEIYPNPSSGMVTIQVSDASTSFEIFDLNGKVVGSGSLNSGLNYLNFDKLAPGSYVLKAFGNGGVSISQLILH